MIMYLYFYLISFSLIGYGFVTCKYLKIKNFNFGILGMIGIVSLALISFASSLFVKHGQIFNFLILTLGIIFLIFNLGRIKNVKKEIIFTFLSFSLLLLFITVGKNHDDFPYYHFSYIQILTDYSHPYGLGQLNNGFRSPSSIFFISSIFFLPKIGIYLFHISPALILGFANVIFLKIIFDKENFKKQKIISFLGVMFFSFINIFFYRLAEHGTDRSGMILTLLSIIYLISLINSRNLNSYKNKNAEELIKIILILFCFAVTIKPYFIVNFLFILPIIFFKQLRKIFFDLFFSRTFYFCFSLIFFITFYTFINSGCLIFPLTATCFENLSWSYEKEVINQVKIWFELWSKGGANPNFVVDDRVGYISGFNWLPNWIESYFFNKVLDFIAGLLFLSLVIFFTFFQKKNLKNFRNNNLWFIFSLTTLLLVEWFLKHPSLRYGGYHLFALIVFIPLSLRLSYLDIDYNFFIRRSIILLLIVINIFFIRNLIRLNDENSLYGYNPIKSTNYKFIGGDKDFYYRYNKLIKDNYESFKTIEFIGKKNIIIKIN